MNIIPSEPETFISCVVIALHFHYHYGYDHTNDRSIQYESPRAKAMDYQQPLTALKFRSSLHFPFAFTFFADLYSIKNTLKV